MKVMGWISAALQFMADCCRPRENLDVGVFSVLWVGRWVHGPDGSEPGLACCVGEADDLEGALVILHRDAALVMRAHDRKGQVVVMDRRGKQVAAWRGPPVKAPAAV